MFAPEDKPREEHPLLTRDQFRERVFARDRHTCVVPDCGLSAVDAHHLIERRLWADGGYYLANGVSVCEAHHLAAEATTLGCDELRRYAGIAKVVLPEHLYEDEIWDKWGNPILPNGQRLRGELFDDESVQKILTPVLHLFTNRVKYPRTYHLPWSPGVTDDDRVLHDTEELFAGKRVVVTVKMDGENTTLYSDYVHARSLEFQPHPSRDRVKALQGRIGYEIPEGWRVCGENLYAKHAIHYKRLADHFLVFSVWDERNVCQSWADTVTYAAVLGLKTVPVLWEGTWNADTVQRLFDNRGLILRSVIGDDECEGYVVRLAGEFPYRAFRRSVAKYVRKDHVQVHGGHWANRIVVPNRLASDGEPTT